jgi:hypothetical protein
MKENIKGLLLLQNLERVLLLEKMITNINITNTNMKNIEIIIIIVPKEEDKNNNII